MDEVILDEEFGIAEPEHLEMMMDGLIDTVDQQVAGTECLSLTPAQQYVATVLQSSNAVSRIAMVTGNEGFFSTVGDGVKKAWEYIQKMFKAIWNWFFGKEEKGPSILEQTEAQIKACNESLAQWAVADHKLSEHIGQQMITTIEQLDAFILGDDHSVKAEAQELKQELQEAKKAPEAQQVAVTKKVIEKMVKINSRAKRAIRATCHNALEQYKHYYAIAEVDESAKFAGTIFEQDYGHYRQWIKEGKQKPLDALIMIQSDIDGISHAVRAQESLLKAVAALEAEKSQISATFKGGVIHRIKDLEDKLTRKDLRDTTRDKWNKDLSACKYFLSMTTKAIKQIEETCNAIQRINNMIMRLFGIPMPKAKGKK